MSRTIIALWVAACGFTLAQQPAFDVVSVKPSAPGSLAPGWEFPPGGRFTASNVPLIMLLEQVYQVRNFQIVGDPNWLAMISFDSGPRYDIDAKGDSSASRDQVKERVKTLLGDRFKLKLHKETSELPVYALIPAKTGVKLQPTKNPDGQRDQLGSLPGWMEGANDSGDTLAALLGERADRPVLNKTGVTYAFDFRLTWTPDTAATPYAAPAEANCPPFVVRRAEQRGEPLSCPSFFTAVQDQLGLKLDPQKAPVDVLVIDHVERPAAN